MEFEEWQRLTKRLKQLNEMIYKTPPSAFTEEERSEMQDEADEINDKLYDPSDQSTQERNFSDPLYGKD